MLTDTTRRLMLLTLVTLALASLLTTDGHTLLAALALAITYTAVTLAVGIAAAFLLDLARTHRTQPHRGN